MGRLRQMTWGIGMTDHVLTTPTHIKAELTKIESLIVAASRLVGDGRLIDLSTLERSTASACDAAVALPALENLPLLPIMEHLIESLDDLTKRLTEEFGSLPKLQGEAAPSTAAMAYGRSQSQDR